MNRTVTIAAAAAVAVCIAWFGLRLETSDDATVPAADRGVPVPAGEASAPSAADRVPIPAAASWPKVRIPAHLPQFTLRGLNGAPSSIGQFKGRSLIINFWATWCAPCRREIPLLQSIQSAWQPQRFSVVGIAVDRRASVLRFARRFKINYPLMSGEQDALNVATAFGVATPAFPFTVFSDRRGRIVTLYLGELHRPQIELILAVVKQLNADRIGLPAARREVEAGLTQLNAGAATG